MLFSNVILPKCSTSTVCVLHQVKRVSMCRVESHVDLDSSWLNVEFLTNNPLEAPNVTRRHGRRYCTSGNNNFILKKSFICKAHFKTPKLIKVLQGIKIRDSINIKSVKMESFIKNRRERIKATLTEYILRLFIKASNVSIPFRLSGRKNVIYHFYQTKEEGF